MSHSHGIAILFLEQTNLILLTAFNQENIWTSEITVLDVKTFFLYLWHAQENYTKLL